MCGSSCHIGCSQFAEQFDHLNDGRYGLYKPHLFVQGRSGNSSFRLRVLWSAAVLLKDLFPVSRFKDRPGRL